MILARWLSTRALRWTAVVAMATALLAFLVEWVERTARASGGEGHELVLAALAVPEHLVRATPLVAALGAAIAVAGMRRAGEWQALSAAGCTLTRRLGWLALCGGLAGLGGLATAEWGVPPSAWRAASLAGTSQGSTPLPRSGSWMAREDEILRVEGLRGADLRILERFRFEQGVLRDRTTWSPLNWNGRSWTAPSTHPALPPALPSPVILRARMGTGDPARLRWGDLASDPRPRAQAERHARWSRAVSCSASSWIGGAFPATVTASSWGLGLAVVPVVASELVATVLQAGAHTGGLPPVSNALARLAVLLLTVLWLRRRTGAGDQGSTTR